MNRRGVALVVGVVVLIGLGAWWLSALPVEVTPSPPPAPSVEIAPPAIVQPIAPPSEPSVVTPPLEASDAGVLADVEIDVVQNGKQVIGVRVELDGPGGRVSRPTDVMGYARFTLPPGTWRITAPASPWRSEAKTLPLIVTAPLTRYRVELPTEWVLRGRVVDRNNHPVVRAEVSWAPFGNLDQTVTDMQGEFSIRTTEPALRVRASRGATRSMLRSAGPGQPLTLVLEEWTQLKVTSTPDSGGCLFVRVMHRDEIVAVGCDGEPMLVPVGQLSVLARRSIKGRALSGRARIESRAGIENRLEVELGPTPPITGTLVDSSGNPMPGVALHIRQLEWLEPRAALGFPGEEPALNALLRRADAGVPALSATTRTNNLGEFSWQPTFGRTPDPIFQVVVLEMWQARADPVLVKLDDAPLSIEVEPAPPR